MAELGVSEPADRNINVVAHCLLDPFTRVRGLEDVPFKPEGAIVQLPCPEALYLGLNRWAVTRNQMDVPAFRRLCWSLITPYADLLQMLAREGVRLKIIGIAGSPSCGICTTSSGYLGGRVYEAKHNRVPGKGIFMEKLLAELERRSVPFQSEEKH